MNLLTHRRALACAFLAVACIANGASAFASPAVDEKIAAAVATSMCADYRWRDRGRAPVGYVKGMAVLYSKAYREFKGHADAAATVVAGDVTNVGADALAWYGQSNMTALERLRTTYALEIGEGMRESGGNPTEGPDQTVANPTEETAEAGLFQLSHNSIGSSPWLPKLYTRYATDGAACRAAVFMEGVTDRKAAIIGTGPGAAFQRRMKSCPALAVEYAAVMLRVNRRHFGPIVRREAELVPACQEMLRSIEALVDVDQP